VVVVVVAVVVAVDDGDVDGAVVVVVVGLVDVVGWVDVLVDDGVEVEGFVVETDVVLTVGEDVVGGVEVVLDVDEVDGIDVGSGGVEDRVVNSSGEFGIAPENNNRPLDTSL